MTTEVKTTKQSVRARIRSELDNLNTEFETRNPVYEQKLNRYDIILQENKNEKRFRAIQKETRLRKRKRAEITKKMRLFNVFDPKLIE